MSTKIENRAGSVGVVETRFFSFGEVNKGLLLESGVNFGPVTIAYETYGEMNEDKSNCILICHALTGDAHVAGFTFPDEKKPGWWDNMVGPGKTFDTDKYFVICSNIIGGCKGSSGPASINPQTGYHYGMDFPIVTIKDMVDAQKMLIDHLGIRRLFAVAGGSFGGMQVLQWAVSYPDMVRLAVPIATTARVAPQAIAFDAVGRHAIMNDPNWNGGDYYGKEKPNQGLRIARMIGHIQYLSDLSMQQKFARNLQNKEKPDYNWSGEFQVESYLDYQGDTFVKRFDANSYLYITKAMDYFDLSDQYGSIKKAFAETEAAFLVISFSSDWLFPSSSSKEIVSALRKANKDVSYAEIQSDYGHDAFLLESETIARLISNFMEYAL